MIKSSDQDDRTGTSGLEGSVTRIVVAGGSGLIGQALVASLRADGHETIVLTRTPGGPGTLGWDARTVGDWAESLGGAYAVVNLAGHSIGSGRWTRRRKDLILRSRVDSTSALVDAIGGLPAELRPRVFVCSSGIDYAGDRPDDAEIDESAAPGDSFLARVCVAWEDAALRAEEHGVRVVVARTSFVIGKGAPALRLMALPFRLFAGGRLGSGRQWFPWVHIDDTVGIYRSAIGHEHWRGAVNVVAPSVPRQRELAQELGKVLHRPAVLRTPAPVLRLALGEQADLLLTGQRAVPRKAEQAGYRFMYPELGAALEQALR
jgi:uncharacterized protein (TIGR01777 family)